MTIYCFPLYLVQKTKHAHSGKYSIFLSVFIILCEIPYFIYSMQKLSIEPPISLRSFIWTVLLTVFLEVLMTLYAQFSQNIKLHYESHLTNKRRQRDTSQNTMNCWKSGTESHVYVCLFPKRSKYSQLILSSFAALKNLVLRILKDP